MINYRDIGNISTLLITKASVCPRLCVGCLTRSITYLFCLSILGVVNMDAEILQNDQIVIDIE